MTLDEPRGPAPFVAFYSCKGGVGRSMALINVAGILAGRGFRVLALDMDLEAPGISYLMQHEANRAPADTPGFVDLLADAVQRGEQADLFALDPVAVVERYSYVYQVPEAIRPSEEGLLRIMPAGRLDDGYQARLDALMLGQLYREGVGRPLIAAFKQLVQDARQFDFVFVDSRTGFSDEAGICTRDLADHLVVVMGLNRQNVEGTAAFLRSLRAAGVSPSLRVVLSPVPNGEDELVDRREREAAEALGAAYGEKLDLSLQIPYHPRLALTEEPHIFRKSRGYLYEAYARIESAVLAMVGLTVDRIRKEVTAAAEAKQIVAVARGLRCLAKLDGGTSALEGMFWSGAVTELCTRDDAGEVRLAFADGLASGSWALTSLAGNLADSAYEDAPAVFERALQRAPDQTQLLTSFARYLAKRDPERADTLYRQALVVEPESTYALASYAWFLALADRDVSAAADYYRRAVETAPTQPGVITAYANFLWKRGSATEAETFYKRAADLNPLDPLALSRYAHFVWRERHDQDAAEALFERAIEGESAPAEALNLCGFFMWRQRHAPDRAEALYMRAIATYPRSHTSHHQLALLLQDVRQDLEAADAAFARAIKLKPGEPNYLANHARLLFVLRRTDDATELLARAWALHPEQPALECELHFYGYAHARERYPNALPALKALLLAGSNSPDWDLDENVRVAREDGHPAPELLETLARVVSGHAPVSSLDAFSEWQAVDPTHG